MNYIITSTLPLVFGGRTKSLLKRVNLVTLENNTPFTILTTNYNPNYDCIYKHYLKEKFIPDSVEFENIYDFFRNTSGKMLRPGPEISIQHNGYRSVPVRSRNAYKYFDAKGIYTFFKSFENPKGTLKFIDYICEETTNRYLRREYDDNGICHREIHYLNAALSEMEEVYFDNYGKIYLIVQSIKSEGIRKIQKISFPKGGDIKTFKKESEWFQFAFENMIKPNSNIICDARLLDRALLSADIEKARKIFVLHSSHYSKGSIRNSFKYLLKNSSKVDAIVTLTSKQREDWIKEGGDSGKTIVIPHSASTPFNDKTLVDSVRSSHKFVCISRLSEEKQIDHIITAFKQIVSLHPNAILEIYGDGNAAGELTSLIEKLGLQKQCLLKGYTNNPDKVFRDALCSVLTSKFEGLPLTVLESLVNGCPVISYDIKYGPSELIVQGTTGLLVPQDDIGQLVAAMDKVLSGHRFSVKLKEQYYPESFVRKWQDLLKQGASFS